MTQSQLNDHFTELYETIKTYTERAKWCLSSSHLDTSAILAECYLHLHKCLHLLNTKEDVEAFSKKWIKQNLNWQDAPIKRMYKVNSFEEIPETPSPQYFDYEIYDKAIATFLPTLTAYDRRLWSIYHEKDKTSGRLIAEHLQMSLSTGYDVLRQCKELNRRFRKHLLSQVI